MKWLLLALLLVAPRIAGAQQRSLVCPDCSSLQVETVAGVGLNLALRGPWMEESWRKPIPRALIFSGMSAAYEGLIDVNGWSWKDVGQRALGYAVTEVAIDVVWNGIIRGKW